MNKRQFLAALAMTPRDWIDYGALGLRRRTDFQTHFQTLCPITALTGDSSSFWFIAAEKLHIKKPLALRIIRAADSYPTKWWQFRQRRLRAQLFQACGLTEVQS